MLHHMPHIHLSSDELPLSKQDESELWVYKFRLKNMQTFMFHLVWTGRISFESHLGDFTAERAAGMTKL